MKCSIHSICKFSNLELPVLCKARSLLVTTETLKLAALDGHMHLYFYQLAVMSAACVSSTETSYRTCLKSFLQLWSLYCMAKRTLKICHPERSGGGKSPSRQKSYTSSLSSSYIEDDMKCFGFMQCNFHIILQVGSLASLASPTWLASLASATPSVAYARFARSLTWV